MTTSLTTRQTRLPARARLDRAPSDDPDLLVVKPLGGSDDEIAGIYLPLGVESDQPVDATFPNPTKDDLGRH